MTRFRCFPLLFVSIWAALLVFLLLVTSRLLYLFQESGFMLEPQKRLHQQNIHHHDHKIPNVLIFTHSENFLLTITNSTIDNCSRTKYKDPWLSWLFRFWKKQDSKLSRDERERRALEQNVRKIVELHKYAHVRFLTDDDCIISIQNATRMAQWSVDDQDFLISSFQQEPRGMIKADICRGAALYETGGLYFDVDLGVRLNVFCVLQPSTGFVTVRVDPNIPLDWPHANGFFQAFIGATPGHVVILEYLCLILQYYRNTLPNKVRGMKDFLGVILLKRAYQEVQSQQQRHESMYNNNGSASSSASPLPPLLRFSELWQESAYENRDPRAIVIPPPTWGRNPACHKIVQVGPRLPTVVPFYSRIANSRLCPADGHK